MGTLGFGLVFFSGIAWTVVYVFLIYKGLKEKTYGMPLVALALNFAWELIYAVSGFRHSPGNIQTWVNLIWCLFDVAIIYCYFRYGRQEYERFADKRYFIPWSVLIFFMAFVLQYGFSIEFGTASAENLSAVSDFIDPNLGAWYSAFLQNLIMSILFINMLVLRKSAKGQSMVIAFSKWVGTLAPTILFGIILENRLVLIMGFFCSVFDVIYICLLSKYVGLSTEQSR